MPSPSGNRTYRENKELKKHLWWYEAIIDEKLANPRITNFELGEKLATSEQYISLIVNSDSFKAHFSARRKAVSEAIDASIVNRLQLTADRALEIVSETLEKKRNTIPFAALADFTHKTLATLGYGAQRPSAAVQVNVQQNVMAPVSASELAEARNALRRAEEAKRLPLIESAPTGRPKSDKPFEEKELSPIPVLRAGGRVV